jgi:hypothetical protein
VGASQPQGAIGPILALTAVDDIEQTDSGVSVASRSPTYAAASTVQAASSWLFFGLQELGIFD